MNRHHTLLLLALTGACSRTPPAAPPATQPSAVAAPTAAVQPVSDASAEADLTVTSPPRGTLLAVGDAAPSFQAVTHNGRHVESDGAARPRALVVYFYPRDETPGCTREACAFRDASHAFDDAGADIVGVSTDTKQSHEGFALQHQLPFGLITDPQGRLAHAFGLDTSSGHAPRVTFVIGRDGRVGRVFPDVRVDGHPEEVLAAVRGLVNAPH